MKVRNLIVVCLAVFLAISLVGCMGKSAKNVYKISFNSNGGSKVEDIEATKSTKITAPIDPTKNGYSFVGWYSDSLFTKKFQFTYMPGEDITLYASWSLDTFTVNYEVGKGKNNKENITIYNVLQNNFKLLDPIQDGYYFAGWYLDSSFSSKVTEIETSLAEDLTLYAKWANNETSTVYNIVYYLNGGINGNNPSSYSVSDSNIILANPTKEGYTFMGWFTDEGLNNLVTSIDTTNEKDINLYAKWEEASVGPTIEHYSITYYLNGGTNANNPIRYTEDMGTIQLEDPIKVSSTFEGWYSDKEFTNQITSIDCSKKENVLVYAKWTDGITIVNYEFDFGIGREITLYHVSDTHINNGTSKTDLASEESWMTGRYSFAQSFGEKYNEKNLFKSSTATLEAIINYINNESPDAVCYTGDIMDYYSVANFNYVNTELAKTEVPYVYALGNHESPSSGYTGMTGMDTTAFTVIDFGDFEIVCLDNSNTDVNGCYCYSEEQYELLKAETLKNKPIIIAQHVPLLTRSNCDSRLEECGTYYYIDENSCNSATQKVVDLICNNSNIKMVLCGHVHGGTLTYITDTKPQITCSSGLIGTINKIIIR